MTKEMNYFFKFAALVLLFVGIIACEGKFKEEKPCIEQTIEEIQSSPVWNPPAKIYQYRYNGQIVYYIPARCCDIPSVLLDKNCNPIGYTNGFTGKPDSIMADFEEKRTDEKLIWEDKRSYEIDMSNIDFSNIEDLYAQPLPVIQKAIQGKWMVYQTCGGDAGCSYAEDCFCEYTNSQVVWNVAGNTNSSTYRWEKVQAPIYGELVNTYAICNTEDIDFYGGAVFVSIVNDTLYVQNWAFNPYYQISTSSEVRVKDNSTTNNK